MPGHRRSPIWEDEPPPVYRGEPDNLDDPVPNANRRPWIMWLMGHLDRMILVLFLAVFVYMLLLYLLRE